jgi:DNA-directed RNA polymerase specialized sigma24 family protein
LRTGANPKDLRPWLFGIANDRLADQRVDEEFIVPDTDFNPVPDRCALNTFIEADTELERQQVVSRNLPVFLELMHNAVDGMPTKLREVIGTLVALTECHPLEFDQRGDTIDAAS